MADPLSVAASIAGLISLADVVFTRLVKYGKAVKNAEKDLKELTKDVNLLGGSLDSLSRLARALEDGSFNKNLHMDYIDDCNETLEEMKDKLGKVEADTVKGRLFWPGRSSRLKAWHEDISRHQRLINAALSADTLHALLQILSREDQQREEILSEIRDTRSIVSRVDKDSRRSKVEAFFLKCNPQENYEMSLQLRHPRTGLWLINRLPQFQHWLSASKSMLWLKGIPGGGKTVLAGSIIEAALGKSTCTDSIATAFFFCDYKDPVTQSPETILGVLAYQLSIQNEDAYELLVQYYDGLHPKQALPRAPDISSLKVLLQKILGMYGHVYLILDGLDECGNTTEDVVDVLIGTFDEAENVSTALLSRDEDAIRDRLSDCCVSIEVAAHKHDIMEYVTAQIQERIRVGKLSAYDPELKAEIIQGLVDGAKGMFRWVSCQLDHLKDCVSDQDCRDALMALPPTLDETYARILSRVPRGKQRLVQLTLQFIAYASPKLTIRQLREALSVPERHGCLEPRQIVHLNAITKYCSSLVRESNNGKYLEFSHFSVQEFLRTSLSQDPDLVGFRISKRLSHQLLAVECLRFLQLRNFYRLRFDPKTEEEEIKTRKAQFPFYSYAAKYWPIFARHSWDDAQILDLGKSLFHPKKSPYFTSWAISFAYHTSNLPIQARIANYANPSFTPLHMAAALSLEEMCLFLVEQGADVAMKSEVGCPLQCAVQGLLFMSADTDNPHSRLTKFAGLYHETLPSEETIKLLCQAGASLDTTSTQIYPGESLLEVAFSAMLLTGRLAVPTVLIKLGISVCDKDLERADKMLQKFSDRSSNDREETYITSLQPFVESLDQRADKSPEILRLCSMAWEAALRAELEFTFDTMAIDTRVTLTLGDLETQAIAATKAFNQQALQKIMSDPRCQTPRISDAGGNTLLHIILMKFGYNMEKSLEITKLLLNAGCDILRPNNDGQQPLHLWDENLAEKNEVTWPQNPTPQAFQKLMQMITEMGATCASRDGRGKNALHYHIISSSHLQAVLDAQSTEDITTALEDIDEDGFTPLALSLKKGLLKSASILTKTLKMSTSAMASPIPILGLAVNANATDILDLLIPLAWDSDLETNKTLFHHMGPGATASNIRRLKSLYPDAWACCVDGRTPFEAYLERCLEKGVVDEIDPDVMDELSVLKPHAADAADYSKIWARFAQYAVASESEQVVTSAGISLLKLGYMRVFEKQNRVSGIIPMLAAFNEFQTTLDLQPISTELICRILRQSQEKSNLQEEPRISRLLAAAAVSLDFELVNLLLADGVSVHRRVDGLSALEVYCISPPDVSVNPGAERMLDLLLQHAEKSELNQHNPRRHGMAVIHLLAQPGTQWMVEKLVRRGADPNLPIKGIQLEAPVVHQLLQGRPSFALALIRNGADPNMEDFIGWDAALASAHTGEILVLAEIFANDNAKTAPCMNWERTCSMRTTHRGGYALSHKNSNGLHAGASGGSIDVVNFYLDNGLIKDMDAKTSEGWTPLHFAAFDGHAETIKLLCGRGANVNVRCNAGRSPLHHAAECSELPSAKALVEAGGKAFADFSGCKPSFYADVSKDQALHEWLLSIEKGDAGERPSNDLVDLEGASGPALSTICATAILENDIHKLELLAMKAFDFESPLTQCGGCSGLIYAIKLGQLDIIRWLLQRGADITRPAYCAIQGRTGLHMALENVALVEIIPQCLENFAMNGGQFLGHTPSLIVAAVAGINRKGLNHLLTYLTRTTHKIARKQQTVSGDPRNLLTTALGEFDDQGETPLIFAISNRNLAAVEMLLNFGADINGAELPLLNTPLHAAVGAEDDEVVSMLIRKGADLELRNRDGKTPLLLAASMGTHASINALLDAGADRTASDYRKRSILDVILYGDRESCNTFVESARAGVNPHIPRALGFSAFHQAVEMPHFASCILNSEFRLEDSLPYNWGFVVVSPAWINTAYRLFRKKYGAEALQTFANMTSSDHWSPLCQFASRVDVKSMENLLDLKCPLDYEGCPFGSALMAACVDGRMESVAFLVRAGASLTYYGPNGYRSAFVAARKHTTIVRWLLVGRFVDQNKLDSPYGFSDTRKHCQPVTWGGPIVAEVVICGELERRPAESSQAYWSRLLGEKLNWRGKVPPLARERRTIRPSKLTPVEKVRIHSNGYDSLRSRQIHDNGDSDQDDKRDMRSQTIPKMVFDGLLWYTPWTA